MQCLIIFQLSIPYKMVFHWELLYHFNLQYVKLTSIS